MIVPPIGAIRGVETNNLGTLVESLSKTKSLLQILSYALTLNSFQVPHSNYKQNRPRESKLQPSQLLPTAPCIIVGQGKVVVVAVVINAPYPSLSLKYRTKVNYNHQNGDCV